jgi:hypothetical protein
MANEILGGLAQAPNTQNVNAQQPPPVNAQQPQPSQPSPLQQAPAPQPSSSSQDLISEYFQKVKDQDEQARTALNIRRQKLLELTGARKQMFDPKMLRLSAAFARPTKTGSFGESFGYAAEAMADEQEKELARKQQELKLQMEIEQMMQSQGRQMLGQELAANIFKNRGAPAAAPAPAAASAPMPAAPPPINTDQNMPAVNATPAPVPAPVQQTVPQSQMVGLPPRKQDSFDNVDADTLFALNLADEKLGKLVSSAKEEGRKNRETQIKEAEFELKGQSVKGMIPGVGANEMPIDFWNKLRNTTNMDEVKSLYTKYNLPWNVTKEKDGTQRFMTPNELTQQSEEGKAKLSERPEKYTIPEIGRGQFELLPSEYREYRKAKAEGKDALQQWFNTSRPEFGAMISGAKNVKPTGEATVVESIGEREAREAKEKKVGEQRAISEVKNRDEIIKNAKSADSLQTPALAIYNLAKDPVRGKALGLLEDPTVGDAFMGVVAQGAQVGSYNVGIPAIRDAVAKLSGNNKEEAQKIMSSLQMLARNFSIIELNLTRQYLQGEGAVTEGERAIVRNISGGVGSRRDVAMAQAEMFIQRAEFDRRVKQELLSWEKKNPNRSFDEFSESDGYKNLWRALNNNMDSIYNKYYGDKTNTKSPANKPTTEGRQLPADSSVNTPVYGIDANGKPYRKN